MPPLLSQFVGADGSAVGPGPSLIHVSCTHASGRRLMLPSSLKSITRRGEPPLALVRSALKSKLGATAGAAGGTWWKLTPAKLV